MMRSRTRFLLSLLALVITAGALVVWLIWFRPSASSVLAKRLVGGWEGTGQVTGELGITTGEGVSGGTATVATNCTIQAEFRPDGTYTWKEQHKGDGIGIDYWLPKEDGPPARWEVVRAQGNRLTVRIHYGEVVFEFQDENAFTMSVPEAAKASGTLAFRRSAIVNR